MSWHQRQRKQRESPEMAKLALDFLERNVVSVATLLAALGNERRLLILCKLARFGEASVTALAESVGLSKSALSQHLAKLRNEDLVTFRRESQTRWYRIADHRIESFLKIIDESYC